MNRGVFHGSLVQQMMSSTSTSSNTSSSSNGSSNWWSINPNTTRLPHDQQQTFPSLPIFPHYPNNNNNLLPFNHIPTSLDSFPEPWTQIFLGGYAGEEDKYGSSNPNFLAKRMLLENWEDRQGLYSSYEVPQSLTDLITSGHDREESKIQQETNKCQWSSQILSSPRSCLNTSFSSNMLDFSDNTKEIRSAQDRPENSSECNSTASGAPFKKARVQLSSSAPQITTFKVRKEKLGDRITALHQLISPFGKTDTASVLLEAIGYIRFLHAQIQALSSPYLGTGNSANNKQTAQGNQMTCLFPEDPGQLLNESGIKKRGSEDLQQELSDEPKKDLKSRGLCLVPVSYTMHVGSENGADFWAPMAFGAGFQ